MAETVLVTGGAGYIGSHTCKALALAGYTPVTYDNLMHGHEWAVKWGPLEKGDLLDKDRLRSVISKHEPVAVMHFAGLISVRESVSFPDLYYRNNVVGSLCLLEIMNKLGLGKLVFSSTAAVYGMPQQAPIPESHPLLPVNPYGASKLVVENMLADFSEAYGLRYVSLRYFNAAGADPDGEIGEAHDPETHLIPLVLDAAAGRRPYISVFGNDYNTTDGTCIRDYIHVYDLADAHVLALKRLLEGGKSTAYNLGTGHGYSVREVLDVVRRVTGRTISERIAPRRAGDASVLVADATRVRQELHWTPTRTKLDTQVADAWRWGQQARRDKMG